MDVEPKWEDKAWSDEELDKFVAFLKDEVEPYNYHFNLFTELEFLERRGFDSGWARFQVSEAIKSIESPLHVPLPGNEYRFNPGCRHCHCGLEFIRSAHLQLREHVRQTLGLPALTDAERANWTPGPPYPLLRPPRYPDSDKLVPNVPYTESQIETVIAYVRTNFPLIAAYQHALNEEYRTKSYRPSEWPPGGIGLTDMYLDYAILDSIELAEGQGTYMSFTIRPLL